MYILTNFITYNRDILSSVESHGEYGKSISVYNFAITYVKRTITYI